MKTAELTGAALDWAVAKCEGAWVRDGIDDDCPEYSTEWSQGGPIIERECIELGMCADQWRAVMHLENGSIYADDQTPLVAAMRCYVASKLGETVDIPEELA